MHIVAQLQELGFEFDIKETGEGFKIHYPGGQPPPETLPLIEKLKANRQEAMAYLQAQVARKTVPVKNQAEEPAHAIDFQAETEKITMALMKQGLAKIYSETLGEEVWWAKDGKEAAKAPAGAVVYTLAELEELARGNPTREGLRQVHGGKKIFGGSINDKNIFLKGGKD